MNQRGADTTLPNPVEDGGLNREMAVLLGAVFDTEEHGDAVDLRLPGEMIALTDARTQRDSASIKMILKRLGKLTFNCGVLLTTGFGPVESGRAIAFPIVDVESAHAVGGFRFHHAATIAPMMFWMTPLNTAAAAASGIAAKC